MVILTEKSKIKSIARRVMSSHILGDWIPDYVIQYSHGKEKYTEFLPEHFKNAILGLQFRIGSHKLPVNNRKHSNVPRADIHCTHCDRSLMGDEIHFLYECTKLINLKV